MYLGALTIKLAKEFDEQFFPCSPDTTQDNYEKELFDVIGRWLTFRKYKQ
jgi:hypothetical protein